MLLLSPYISKHAIMYVLMGRHVWVWYVWKQDYGEAGIVRLIAHARVGLPLGRMDVDGSWMAALHASLMFRFMESCWPLARWFLTVRMAAAFGVDD
jgi:hypothetical protein